MNSTSNRCSFAPKRTHDVECDSDKVTEYYTNHGAGLSFDIPKAQRLSTERRSPQSMPIGGLG